MPLRPDVYRFISSLMNLEFSMIMKSTLKCPLLPLACILAAVVASFSVSARAADAKALYEQHCASCHGKDGKGNTRMGRQSGARDYTDAKVQESIKDEAALKAISEGVKDKDSGKEKMKPFAEKLNAEESKALLAYIREFCKK